MKEIKQNENKSQDVKKEGEKAESAKEKEQTQVKKDLDRDEDHDKERLKNSKNVNEKEDENDKDKKAFLINIHSKVLKEEYDNKVNYIFKNCIISIALSVLIFVQGFLINKNFRLYTENLVTLFLGIFVLFNSLLIIFELLKNTLRDKLRFKSLKIFSLCLSILLLCLFVFHILNSLNIYNKIKKNKKRCERRKKGCDTIFISNIILIMSCLIAFIILILIKFQMWMGYDSIRVLLGYEMEVVQKQILEDDKENKENDKKTDENLHKKQD